MMDRPGSASSSPLPTGPSGTAISCGALRKGRRTCSFCSGISYDAECEGRREGDERQVAGKQVPRPRRTVLSRQRPVVRGKPRLRQPEREEENSRLLQQELQGRSPAGGIEVRVMRKDGVLFDARMYVSPLTDARGKQTGWMTSMTNITEAKRIRDQLSASHERFTTVLEGLDAAVSVLSVEQGELLFANRSYRLWFGADARGHNLLAGEQATEVDVSLPDSDDNVDTLGGLVFKLAGRVPGRGEILTHSSGIVIEILDADPRRVNRVLVRRAG